MQAAVSRSGSDPLLKNLTRAIALISFAGIIVSSVSLYHHFGTSKTSFCAFGESFNCDLVSRSRYSVVLGMTVALIGSRGYMRILDVATVDRVKAETPVMLLIAASGGLAFALYLTYIEKFVRQACCVLCLGSLARIFSAA